MLCVVCGLCLGNVHITKKEQWPKLGTPGSPMAKTGYPLLRESQGAILLANARPGPTLTEFQTGPPDSGYSPPHRLPDFNHTYPVMAGVFDQQPTRARARADASSRHRGTRRGIFAVDVVVRAAEL